MAKHGKGDEVEEGRVGIPGRALAFLVEGVGWIEVDAPEKCPAGEGFGEPVEDESTGSVIFRSAGCVLAINMDRVMGVKYDNIALVERGTRAVGKGSLRAIRGGDRGRPD